MSGSGGTATGGLDRVTVARHLPSLALCLSLGVAVGSVLSLASWVLSGGAAERPSQTFEYVIPAGTSERIQAGDGFVCTFHPAGTVDLAVRGRPDAAPLVWSALLLGLPLGAGGAGVLWVARGLGD